MDYILKMIAARERHLLEEIDMRTRRIEAMSADRAELEARNAEDRILLSECIAARGMLARGIAAAGVDLALYRGYAATVAFDEADEVFHGRVSGTGGDVVTFEADNAEDLATAFRDSVDDWLAHKATAHRDHDRLSDDGCPHDGEAEA